MSVSAPSHNRQIIGPIVALASAGIGEISPQAWKNRRNHEHPSSRHVADPSSMSHFGKSGYAIRRTTCHLKRFPHTELRRNSPGWQRTCLRVFRWPASQRRRHDFVFRDGTAACRTICPLFFRPTTPAAALASRRSAGGPNALLDLMAHHSSPFAMVRVRAVARLGQRHH